MRGRARGGKRERARACALNLACADQLPGLSCGCGPVRFFRSNLRTTGNETAQRSLFEGQMATRPLLSSKREGFWMARSGLIKADWLPHQIVRSSFDAVVHFVQAAGGTGVHVGQGKLLTCAHGTSHADTYVCMYTHALSRPDSTAAARR